MKSQFAFPQMFLRIAIGVGFILPVLDRFGLLGAPGTHHTAWGDWRHFLNYTHTLIPYVSLSMAKNLAIASTVLEVGLGLCLILGIKVRAMAIISFLLTLIFAVSMFLYVDYKAPIYASVFVVSAGSLLLAAVPKYKWVLSE